MPYQSDKINGAVEMQKHTASKGTRVRVMPTDWALYAVIAGMLIPPVSVIKGIITDYLFPEIKPGIYYRSSPGNYTVSCEVDVGATGTENKVIICQGRVSDKLYYVRGIIDGDGGIKLYQFKLGRKFGPCEQMQNLRGCSPRGSEEGKSQEYLFADLIEDLK